MLDTVQKGQTPKATTPATTVPADRMGEYKQLLTEISYAEEKHQEIIAKFEETENIPPEIEDELDQKITKIAENLEIVRVNMKQLDNPNDDRQYTAMLKVVYCIYIDFYLNPKGSHIFPILIHQNSY